MMDAPRNDSLRILHLLSFAKYTGPAEPVLRLARAQMQAGHSVRLAIDLKRRGNLREKAGPYGVPLDDGFVLSPSAGPLLQWRNLRRLRDIWKGNAVDILHVHRTNDHFLAALARPAETSVRLVRTLHTERAQSRMRSWLLHRADGLIVVAQKYRMDLLNRGFLDENRIVSVDGVVDPDEFHPGKDRGARIRQEFGISQEAPVAGIVARMKHGRGHRWLLESWAMVHEKIPEAVLFLAGRGPIADELEAFAGAHAWGRSVKFIGYRKDLPDVYPSFDVKVILAPGNDGTCRAALEAMASGVPVIAAERGALTEIIEENTTGFLVPAEDRQALAGALTASLANAETIQEMGKDARRAALVRFNIERQHGIIQGLYRRAMDAFCS